MNDENQTVMLLILKTGERVLAKLNDNQCESPMILMPGSADGSVMMIPYLQYSEDNSVPFREMDCKHIVSPMSELADSYLSHLSPISVPAKKIVMPGSAALN